jgi:hypothetical protein
MFSDGNGNAYRGGEDGNGLADVYAYAMMAMIIVYGVRTTVRVTEHGNYRRV